MAYTSSNPVARKCFTFTVFPHIRPSAEEIWYPCFPIVFLLCKHNNCFQVNPTAYQVASQRGEEEWSWSDLQLRVPPATVDVFQGNRVSGDFLDFQYHSEALQYPLYDIFR